METNKIYHGEAKEVLSQFPDKSINTCVTSPPYWGLRDYGVEGQLGLEPTPEEYVERLVNIFAEVKRILKDDGTLWLNLGDSYAGSGKGPAGNINKDYHHLEDKIGGIVPDGLKQKDLVGIPWRVAFALQKDGWYLRNDIIWHKSSAMPESVKDRCTTSHEHIFLLAKSKQYYYDNEAIKEPAKSEPQPRERPNGVSVEEQGKREGEGDITANCGVDEKRNKRDVWKVNTKSFPEAHFAVYPPELIRPCIKAGCPEDGVVLDPFIGAGTTALVALRENKNFVGIELNQEYIDIAYKRIGKFDKNYYQELPEDKKPKQKQLF